MHIILKSKDEFEKIQSNILTRYKSIVPNTDANKRCNLNKHQSKYLYACDLPNGFVYPITLKTQKIDENGNNIIEDVVIECPEGLGHYEDEIRQYTIDDGELYGKTFKIKKFIFDRDIVNQLPSDWYKETDII